MSKEKIEMMEELLKQKINHANSIKESMRPLEAFHAATKEICKKIKDIIEPKKTESLEMLSKNKMQGEAYRYLTEILNSISSVLESSHQESEKLYFTKQQELNFVANEFTKMKEIQGKMIAEINKAIEETKKTESKQEEIQKEAVKESSTVEEQKNPEYIRPDKNPNTRMGRAAMDLQKRKEAALNKEDSENKK